eukprot:993618-Amphidinium_carterae.1
MRVKAEIFAEVPGGRLAYYDNKGLFQASCSRAGHGRCVLTRSALPGRRPAQGRPLGLLVAWLGMGHTVATKEQHWDKTLWPAKPAREAAREELQQYAGGLELLACERALGAEEGEEPDDLP